MDNHLTADRIENLLMAEGIEFGRKQMFGGDCFMVDDKMLIGTYKGGIMARVDPAENDNLLARRGATQMIHGGRPMAGYVFLETEGYESETDLAFWIQKCLEYNPKIKAKPKKKAQ